MTATETISQVTSINHHTPSDSMTKLKLLSPVGADSAEYDWPLVISNKFNAANEIFETIRFVCEEFSDLEIALKTNVLQFYDPQSFDSMKILCDKYNKVIKDTLQMCKGTSIRRPTSERPSTDLLHHVIQMCYNYSIGDPHKLNKFYEPFSPEVYGETSFQFVQQMIDTFKFSEDDVFIDLGSGVGQVVLHVAAATKCRCIGIEKADLPAKYAEKMENRFKFWIKWFGKQFSDFDLYKGDFFNKEYKQMIQSASFIFVNNFAFGPEVDHKLKLIFEGLQDGCKILSSKAFCSLKFKMSHRNLNDIGAILNVQEILPVDNQSVSWTGKPVSYYLQTIDREPLEKYFETFHLRDKQKKVRNKKICENLNTSHSSESSSEQVKEDDSNSNKWLKSIDSTSKCPDPSNVEAYQTNEINKKKNCRGRPKKIVPVEKNTEIKNETVHEEDTSSLLDHNLQNESCENSTNEEQTCESLPRRPGRPKKAAKKTNSKRKIKGISLHNMDNLDVLHTQTVLSYSKLDSRPPPGCVDQKLTSKGDNLCPVPKIILNEGVVIPGLESMDTPVSSPCSDNMVPSASNPNGIKVYDVRCIEDLMMLLQYSVQQYRHLAKSQDYIAELKRNIEYQQNRKDDLLVEINILNRKIYDANYNNVTYAKQYLAVFGFDSIPELITEYNNMTKSIADHKEEISRLQYLITNCEKENNDLLAQKKQTDEKELLNKIVNTEDSVKSCLEVSVDREVESPKPSYKEMKYKKYKMNENSSNQMTLKVSNKVNVDRSDSVDLTFNAHSEDRQTIEDFAKGIDSDLTRDLVVPNNANPIAATLLVPNNLDRINNIIRKVLNESPNKVCHEDKTVPTESVVNLPSENVIDSKSNQTKTTPKRSRKSKFETIKTKKDRQVILTNSAGCPTTQLVRNPLPPKETKNESTTISANKCEEKMFSLKLRIKHNKVVPITEVPEQAEYCLENGSKRKASSEEVYSYKRKAAGKESKNENSSEPKRPPVVLKISNKGQYYELKNDEDVDSKKSSHRVNSEFSCSVTAKSMDHNTSPSHLSTLKLNTAQHYSNPGNKEESLLNPSKEFSQSPLSLASRSSSVESATSKKTRKRTSKSQKSNIHEEPNMTKQQNDFSQSANSLVYQNGCPSSQSIADNFSISTYQSALNNFISDSTKNIFNLTNGLNQASFDPSALFMNGNNFKNQIMHHRKMKAPSHYESLNSSMGSSIESINYQHQLNKGPVEKTNSTDLLNHQAGINNYAISCRYDNASVYFSNPVHAASDTMETISKKAKSDPQVHNPTHSNGFFNPNPIY